MKPELASSGTSANHHSLPSVKIPPFKLECEFLLLERKVKVKSLSRVRLFATPWTSLPGSPVHGLLQAKILEWVAFPFSRGSS